MAKKTIHIATFVSLVSYSACAQQADLPIEQRSPASENSIVTDNIVTNFDPNVVPPPPDEWLNYVASLNPDNPEELRALLNFELCKNCSSNEVEMIKKKLSEINQQIFSDVEEEELNEIKKVCDFEYSNIAKSYPIGTYFKQKRFLYLLTFDAIVKNKKSYIYDGKSRKCTEIKYTNFIHDFTKSKSVKNCAIINASQSEYAVYHTFKAKNNYDTVCIVWHLNQDKLLTNFEIRSTTENHEAEQYLDDLNNQKYLRIAPKVDGIGLRLVQFKHGM